MIAAVQCPIVTFVLVMFGVTVNISQLVSGEVGITQDASEKSSALLLLLFSQVAFVWQVGGQSARQSARHLREFVFGVLQLLISLADFGMARAADPIVVLNRFR